MLRGLGRLRGLGWFPARIGRAAFGPVHPVSPADLLVRPIAEPPGPLLGLISEFFGLLGRFLRFTGHLLGPVGGLLGQVGPSLGLVRCGPSLVGPPPRLFLLGPFSGLRRVHPGLRRDLLGPDLGHAEAGLFGHPGVPVFLGRPFPGRRGRVTLGGTPGLAVGLTGFGHALTGGGLPRLVLSHDDVFLAGRPASARHGEWHDQKMHTSRGPLSSRPSSARAGRWLGSGQVVRCPYRQRTRGPRRPAMRKPRLYARGLTPPRRLPGLDCDTGVRSAFLFSERTRVRAYSRCDALVARPSRPDSAAGSAGTCSAGPRAGSMATWAVQRASTRPSRQ